MSAAAGHGLDLLEEIHRKYAAVIAPLWTVATSSLPEAEIVRRVRWLRARETWDLKDCYWRDGEE